MTDKGNERRPTSRYHRLRGLQRAGETFIADSVPYIRNALERVLEAQHCQVRYFSTKRQKGEPTDFRNLLANYFLMAGKGGHTSCAPMAWVTETHYNRLCFTTLLKELFATWAKQFEDLCLTLEDFRGLIRLLCPDYSDELLRDAAVLAAADQKHLKHRDQDVRTCRLPLELFVRLQELFLCLSSFVQCCRRLHVKIARENDENRYFIRAPLGDRYCSILECNRSLMIYPSDTYLVFSAQLGAAIRKELYAGKRSGWNLPPWSMVKESLIAGSSEDGGDRLICSLSGFFLATAKHRDLTKATGSAGCLRTREVIEREQERVETEYSSRGVDVLYHYKKMKEEEEVERWRVEEEKRRAEEERRRAEKEKQRVEEEKRRAEEEKRRTEKEKKMKKKKETGEKADSKPERDSPVSHTSQHSEHKASSTQQEVREQPQQENESRPVAASALPLNELQPVVASAPPLNESRPVVASALPLDESRLVAASAPLLNESQPVAASDRQRQQQPISRHRSEPIITQQRVQRSSLPRSSSAPRLQAQAGKRVGRERMQRLPLPRQQSVPVLRQQEHRPSLLRRVSAPQFHQQAPESSHGEQVTAQHLPTISEQLSVQSRRTSVSDTPEQSQQRSQTSGSSSSGTQQLAAESRQTLLPVRRRQSPRTSEETAHGLARRDRRKSLPVGSTRTQQRAPLTRHTSVPVIGQSGNTSLTAPRELSQSTEEHTSVVQRVSLGRQTSVPADRVHRALELQIHRQMSEPALSQREGTSSIGSELSESTGHQETSLERSTTDGIMSRSTQQEQTPNSWLSASVSEHEGNSSSTTERELLEGHTSDHDHSVAEGESMGQSSRESGENIRREDIPQSSSGERTQREQRLQIHGQVSESRVVQEGTTSLAISREIQRLAVHATEADVKRAQTVRHQSDMHRDLSAFVTQQQGRSASSSTDREEPGSEQRLSQTRQSSLPLVSQQRSSVTNKPAVANEPVVNIRSPSRRKSLSTAERQTTQQRTCHRGRSLPTLHDQTVYAGLRRLLMAEMTAEGTERSSMSVPRQRSSSETTDSPSTTFSQMSQPHQCQHLRSLSASSEQLLQTMLAQQPFSGEGAEEGTGALEGGPSATFRQILQPHRRHHLQSLSASAEHLQTTLREQGQMQQLFTGEGGEEGSRQRRQRSLP